MELQSLREFTTHQKKKRADSLASFLLDLNDIAQALGAPLIDNTKFGDGLEDDFAAGRLFVVKAKTDVKNILQRCQTLEAEKIEHTKKMEEHEKSLGECRLKLTQTEARMLILQDTAKEMELRRRNLEEQVDALNHECSRLRAQEQVQSLGPAQAADASDPRVSVQEALEKQLEQNLEQHQKQLTALRDEMAAKEAQIDQLRE